MRWRGFNIDSSLFTIKFNPPQNFASYRQAELDAQRVNVFGQMEQLPYMSKRFMMQRFLGLSEEELLQNEKLWSEERNENDSQSVSGSDMRSVGISPGGIEGDLDTGAELEADLDNPDILEPDLGGDAPDAETPPET